MLQQPGRQLARVLTGRITRPGCWMLPCVQAGRSYLRGNLQSMKLRVLTAWSDGSAVGLYMLEPRSCHDKVRMLVVGEWDASERHIQPGWRIAQFRSTWLSALLAALVHAPHQLLRSYTGNSPQGATTSQR